MDYNKYTDIYNKTNDIFIHGNILYERKINNILLFDIRYEKNLLNFKIDDIDE